MEIEIAIEIDINININKNIITVCNYNLYINIYVRLDDSTVSRLAKLQ